MVGYHSEDLVKQFGFEKGLDLLNIIRARDLGMIPNRRAAHFVRENVNFFSRVIIPEANSRIEITAQ